MFFKYFYGRISTSIQVYYNGIFTTPENIIYLKNIHLCTSVFHFFLLKNTFVWVDSNGVSFKWICFLPEEYTPLYKSTKTVFSAIEKNYPKNILLCASWQNWYFLHLKMFLPEEYILQYEFFSIFSLKNFISVWVDKNGVFYSWKNYLQEEYTRLCEHLTNIQWRIFTPVQVD